MSAVQYDTELSLALLYNTQRMLFYMPLGDLHQSQLLLTDVFSPQASRQRHTRVSLCLFPRQDHTHLVHAEGGEGGGQQTRSAQDVPPVEEAEGNSFADAVDAETHQRQRGEELHTQRRPRGRVFLAHDVC